MRYIAAIDIGSNAIRLAIANATRPQLHISYRSREPVRLGSSVFSEGRINDQILGELTKALGQFKNQLENHNVQQFRAVATSAMREASNNTEVVEKLYQATGIRIEIISGDEEARLVSQAIQQKIDLSAGTFLLIDIGGGSIELVAIKDGETLKRQSFVIGMVRVLELHKKQNQDLEDWFPAFIKNEVNDFFDGLPNLEQAVGTGGNMDRFAKLKPFVAGEEGDTLTKSEMAKVYKLLKSVDYEERMTRFALKPDRADVIIPAAIATNEIMKFGRSKLIHFPQVGIKDGILYELSSELTD